MQQAQRKLNTGQAKGGADGFSSGLMVGIAARGKYEIPRANPAAPARPAARWHPGTAVYRRRGVLAGAPCVGAIPVSLTR